MARLPPHSHCLYCDDPVQEGESYCSDDCRRTMSEKDASEKKRNFAFYGLAALALIIVFVLNIIM